MNWYKCRYLLLTMPVLGSKPLYGIATRVQARCIIELLCLEHLELSAAKMLRAYGVLAEACNAPLIQHVKPI